MDLLKQVIVIYLAAINIVTFLLYGIDKWKAKRKRWRITEACLLWMAALGGSPGALLGIRLWHHKTLHPQFRYGVPVILIAQLLAIGALLWWLIQQGLL